MPITLLRASAGSGKTFRLVQEYLRIVLRHPEDFKQVLAITFTKKATKEMKERILESLKSLADGQKGPMYEELYKDPQLKKLKDLSQRAKLVLEAILQNYSYFSVSTIDAFFVRMLTGIIRELKEPVEFSVDLDEDSIFDETKRILYRNIQPETPLLRWLSDYAMDLIEEDKGWNIDRGINDLGKEIFKEQFDAITSEVELDDEVVRKLIDENRKSRQNFKQAIAQKCKRFNEIVDKNNMRENLIKNPYSFVKNLGLKNYKASSKTFDNSIESGIWTKPRMQEDDILHESAVDLDNFYKANYPNYCAYKAIAQNLHMRGIYDYLSSALQELRLEEKVLLLFDVKRVLKDAIQTGDLPLVYEKMGLRYKYFFLDEFQDTSDYQYLVMKPFLDNAASGDDAHAFIVGDVKQSIYRFRGANVELMANKVEKDFSVNVESLEYNYRSSPAIVKFNNAFFEKLIEKIQNELLQSGYKGLTQTVGGESTLEGYVHVEMFDNKTNKTTFEYLRNHVDEVISDGYAYKDIMLLVNTWKDAAAISSYFLTQGSQYKTESPRSLLLGTSKVNALLVCALRCLLDFNDLIAAKSLSDYHHELHGLDFPETISAKDLKFADKLKLPQSFIEDRLRLCRLPAYEIVMELLKMFSLEPMMDDMVYRFLDYLLELSEEGTNSLLDVLAWWDINKDDKYMTTSGSDTMRITTVHSAKGLESPIVMIPKCNFAFTKFKNHWSQLLPDELKDDFGGLQLKMSASLEDSMLDAAFEDERNKQIVDSINKMYVAFTRAKNQLYIFTDNTGNKENKLINTRHALEQVLPEIKGENGELTMESPVVFGAKEKKAIRKESGKINSISIDLIPSASSPQVELAGQSSKFFSLFDNAKSLPIQLGIEIHALLENLVSFDEFETLLDKLIQQGIIRSNHRGDILKMGDQLGENETVKKWFLPKWQVRNEAEILAKGKLFKPDRVMIAGGQAIVVDYKSGEESDKHIEQLNNYGDLLTELGYEQVEKYILYTRDMKVVAV